MYELTKTFRFESAHRLAKDYKGKCKNIHGHSWNGAISVSVPDKDQYDFGVDFGDLKKITKQFEDWLDHKILLYEGDKELIELCEKNNWAYIVFRDNPTCETIAEVLYDVAVSHLIKNELVGRGVKLNYVRIEETCTTSCTYTQN